MEIQQQTITTNQLVNPIEHRLAAGGRFTGVVAQLGGTNFVPYSGTDGVIRMKNADGSVVEGDYGGLFQYSSVTPLVIEHVMADLGSVLDWSLSLLYTTGESHTIASGNARYLNEILNIPVMPGEALKLIGSAGGALASWARVYARPQQHVGR